MYYGLYINKVIYINKLYKVIIYKLSFFLVEILIYINYFKLEYNTWESNSQYLATYTYLAPIATCLINIY